jgi:hypothetical protein
MSVPEAIGSSLEAIIEEAARSYAQRWRIIGTDGFVWCAECVERHALLPSLHCGLCLGAAYSRLGIVVPACLNHEQEGRAA